MDRWFGNFGRIGPRKLPTAPARMSETICLKRLTNMEKTEAHRLPRVVLNERRRRAVKLSLHGATIAETVVQCELGRSAVIRAVQAYERGGWKAVAVPIVGRPQGSGRMLTADQEKKIQQLIQDRTPDQLKLAYALWARQAVSKLIEAVYGVRLTVRNMGKLTLPAQNASLSELL